MTVRHSYAFVRNDLSPVQRIIQMSHASYECALNLEPFEDETPSSMVLFEVENQNELLKVAMYLDKHIPNQFHIFYEPDPCWSDPSGRSMGYTAIATRPFEGVERELFSSFKLYQHEGHNIEKLDHIPK